MGIMDTIGGIVKGVAGGGAAASAVAAVLPKIIDGLTPDGSVPDEDSLLSNFKRLLGK